jgi:uncharacterized 2Fe-2S/4Fe-4S cluster protein (DUF4445 family)
LSDKLNANTELKRVTFLPFNVTFNIAAGTSLLDAIKTANLPVITSCGGKGTCGDCIVHVIKGNYMMRYSAAISENLTRQGYVLACKTEVIDDLIVQLPRFRQLSLKTVADIGIYESNKIFVSGFLKFEPPVRKINIKVPEPTYENKYSDLKRLQQSLTAEYGIKKSYCEYNILKSLPDILREDEGCVTLVLFRSGDSWKIIDAIPGRNSKNIYGIACDIGTTTLVTGLIDLQNGKLVNTVSGFNQQIKCGVDIISRINYAERPGGLNELNELIIEAINNLVQTTAESFGIDRNDIYYAAFSGNTTMTHLFMNINPDYIRKEPYIPAMNKVPVISPVNVGLKINDAGIIHISPLVGSYVGGDITAGLLCTPVLKSKRKISLFIDIGTNGELVIGNKDWIVTCACSAGPAFEGGQIKYGMPAAEGAIENIRFTDDQGIQYKVIGGQKPKGICGSGLVDILAALFANGYIERNGSIIMDKAKEKYIQDDSGKGIIVIDAKESYWEKSIVIYENDIANLIRSKAAVYSACSLLLKNLGINFDSIDAFYISGGFGKNIDIENAVTIGLFPDINRKKYHYLGNTSFYGTYLMLLSEKNKALVDKYSEKMTYIELNTENDYMNEYSASLFLPHTNMRLFPSVGKKLKRE